MSKKKKGDRMMNPEGGRRRGSQVHKSKKKYNRQKNKRIEPEEFDDCGFDVKKHNYKPLPDGLTIRQSKIHGLGLFTLVPIPPEVIIGLSHVERYGFDNHLLRTPLGGFINHSETPNLVLERDEINEEYFYILSRRRIKKNEELTLNYRESICGVINKK